MITAIIISLIAIVVLGTYTAISLSHTDEYHAREIDNVRRNFYDLSEYLSQIEHKYQETEIRTSNALYNIRKRLEELEKYTSPLKEVDDLLKEVDDLLKPSTPETTEAPTEVTPEDLAPALVAPASSKTPDKAHTFSPEGMLDRFLSHRNDKSIEARCEALGIDRTLYQAHAHAIVAKWVKEGRRFTSYKSAADQLIRKIRYVIRQEQKQKK